MTLRDRYFEWLCKAVTPPTGEQPYGYLLRYLADTDFQYCIELDGNREADGFDLRYRFGEEAGVPSREIARYLDNRPCSMLEMMVALALRCEEAIMFDPNKGDRTWIWFQEMLCSLRLDRMEDAHFDHKEVAYRVRRFVCQKYDSDGHGGLFTVKHPYRDMRSIDIWTQLQWWLEEYNKGDSI